MSDRFVPVGVADRDGFSMPMGVVVSRRMLTTLPVFNDDGRIVAEITRMDSATWAGHEGFSRHGKAASAAEARLAARPGSKITARLDARGHVVGFRISR